MKSSPLYNKYTNKRKSLFSFFFNFKTLIEEFSAEDGDQAVFESQKAIAMPRFRNETELGGKCRQAAAESQERGAGHF